MCNDEKMTIELHRKWKETIVEDMTHNYTVFMHELLHVFFCQ